MSKHKHFINI